MGILVLIVLLIVSLIINICMLTCIRNLHKGNRMPVISLPVDDTYVEMNTLAVIPDISTTETNGGKGTISATEDRNSNAEDGNVYQSIRSINEYEL